MLDLDVRIAFYNCMLLLELHVRELESGCCNWMFELHVKKQLGHVQVLAPWSSAMISDLLTRS